MRHAGRKLWHIGGGLFLLWLWFALGRPRALLAYLALLALALAFDLARRALPRFAAWCRARLSAFLREGEAGRLSGMPPYLAGVGLALLLFPEPAAVAAVLFLAFGDVAATTVGERGGRRRVGEKSLEGTAAFFGAALLAGLASRAALGGPPLPALAAGAWSAALLELFMPSWANDNLVIPLAAALFMTLLGGAP